MPFFGIAIFVYEKINELPDSYSRHKMRTKAKENAINYFIIIE
jgi:hypothetical protein